MLQLPNDPGPQLGYNFPHITSGGIFLLLLRRIFFYLFTAIYVVACPMTILYALGYLVKPGTEKGIVKRGLIYI